MRGLVDIRKGSFASPGGRRDVVARSTSHSKRYHGCFAASVDFQGGWLLVDVGKAEHFISQWTPTTSGERQNQLLRCIGVMPRRCFTMR